MTANKKAAMPPQKATTSFAPEISIIIPVYNDAAHIGKSIDALANFIRSENLNAEILIINDGGRDATAEIVEDKSKKHPEIKFLDRQKNKGKGYSIREGLRAANGEIIIFTDADLPYGTGYFTKMTEILKSGADLVIANRNLAPSVKSSVSDSDIGLLRRLTHWGFSFLVRNLLRLRFSDTQAGLKGLRRVAAEKVLPKLKINGFAFDLELLVESQKAGLRIQEIPVILENVGRSNIKIARDSLRMFIDIVKIWLNY